MHFLLCTLHFALQAEVVPMWSPSKSGGRAREGLEPPPPPPPPLDKSLELVEDVTERSTRGVTERWAPLLALAGARGRSWAPVEFGENLRSFPSVAAY